MILAHVPFPLYTCIYTVLFKGLGSNLMEDGSLLEILEIYFNNHSKHNRKLVRLILLIHTKFLIRICKLLYEWGKLRVVAVVWLSILNTSSMNETNVCSVTSLPIVALKSVNHQYSNVA